MEDFDLDKWLNDKKLPPRVYLQPYGGLTGSTQPQGAYYFFKDEYVGPEYVSLEEHEARITELEQKLEIAVGVLMRVRHNANFSLEAEMTRKQSGYSGIIAIADGALAKLKAAAPESTTRD